MKHSYYDVIMGQEHMFRGNKKDTINYLLNWDLRCYGKKILKQWLKVAKLSSGLPIFIPHCITIVYHLKRYF